MEEISTSPQGNVISITRLLKHFDDKHLVEFKRNLYSIIDVSDDNQFLCKILPLIQKSLLTAENMESLKRSVIQMAQQQQIHKDNNLHHNIDNKNNTTVYKVVQQSYNDKLSRLHSSMISQIGSYLNKQDSIKIGHLNKQLYIESQKLSYLKQRRNDEFAINHNTLDRLASPVSNPFAYCLPNYQVDYCCNLILDLEYHMVYPHHIVNQYLNHNGLINYLLVSNILVYVIHIYHLYQSQNCLDTPIIVITM